MACMADAYPRWTVSIIEPNKLYPLSDVVEMLQCIIGPKYNEAFVFDLVRSGKIPHVNRGTSGNPYSVFGDRIIEYIDGQ